MITEETFSFWTIINTCNEHVLRYYNNTCNVSFDLSHEGSFEYNFPAVELHTHTHTQIYAQHMQNIKLDPPAPSFDSFSYSPSGALFLYVAKSNRPKEVCRELWSRRLYVKEVHVSPCLTSLRVPAQRARLGSWASGGTKRHVNFPRRSLPFYPAPTCKWTSWERAPRDNLRLNPPWDRV